MAERDPRQECGCPPWVECEHIGEHLLWLISGREEPHPHNMPGAFAVAVGAEMRTCNCGLCDNHAALFGGVEEDFTIVRSLPEAQAAFLVRRAELLRLGGGDG